MTRRTADLAARALALLAPLCAGACRGQPSEEPPVHINPNMDSQPRYDPQAESKFFTDRATMRRPVEGTVARGRLEEDDGYYRGLGPAGRPLDKLPVPITDALLRRGQERYNIFCAPCHDRTGSGQGPVAQRGYIGVRNLLDDYTRKLPDGQVYSAIAHGVRTMPSYGTQIPPEDRWAIVAYVRALEVSVSASLDDVPQERRASLTLEPVRP
ncbi:MAG TPA: cytochrome c [Polyangiaceae bacterium]|nr:cytochrome c [Polyangiaceae bacterium]